MRAARLLILLGLIVSAAQGGSEHKDELLSLLEEIEPVVADVNTVTEMPPAADVQEGSEFDLPAEPAVAETEAPPAEPEPSETIVEPNTLDPQTVETAALTETEDPCVLEKSRQLRREFFRGQLEPVKTMTSEEQQQKLDALIAKLNSLEPSRKLVVVPEEPEKTEAEAARTDAVQGKNMQDGNGVEERAESTENPDSLSTSLLTGLEKAENVVDPILLADALYRQGYVQAAYPYYRQAAERLGAKEADASQWIQFQMANCLHGSDPAKALEMYSDLLARFPNSRWSTAAQSRKTTLEWIMRESVKELLAGDL
jgi:hypothetical protein